MIIALQVEIPRMKLVAKKYSAINLGYFTEDNSRWMVEVPQHLVVMPSKEVLELRPSDCLIFTPTFACDAVSLAPNQCGESILLGNSTKYCEVREVDNRKCGYFEDNFRAFVSMRDPGVAQFFHHAPSENATHRPSLFSVYEGGAYVSRRKALCATQSINSLLVGGIAKLSTRYLNLKK